MQHVVKANDTPYSLAKLYVKDGNRWPELCKANPQLKKHADWGCVFIVGSAVTLPDTWVSAAPLPPPIPGPVPQPVGPAIPTDPNALAPVEPAKAGMFGNLDATKIMIAGGAVAALVVAVYAMKRKKAA